MVNWSVTSLRYKFSKMSGNYFLFFVYSGGWVMKWGRGYEAGEGL